MDDNVTQPTLSGWTRLAQRICGVTAILIALSGNAIAAPGDLDPTFGIGGRVSLDVLKSSTVDYAAVQQTDGKLVLASTTFPAHIWLARLQANGTLDATFGSNGTVTGAGPNATSAAVIQQTDGKLVVAGDVWSNGQDIALWRFHPGGLADASFGTRGAVWLDLGAFEQASGLVQQTDGKLVVTGITESETPDGRDQRWVLARFNEDGSLDTAFGSEGYVIVDPPDGNAEGPPSSLTLQPDGKFVVAGHHSTSDGSAVAVVRITANGTVDRAFGDNGMVRVVPPEIHVLPVEYPDTYTTGGSVALQKDGRIVVVGTVGRVRWDPWGSPITHTDGFILRLEVDGALDFTFGVGGIVIETAVFSSVAISADGKIVAAFNENRDMGLMRFNAEGSSDRSFGIQGTSIADFGSLYRGPISIAEVLIRQGDGRFVIVGGHADLVRDHWYTAIARFADDTDFPGVIGLGVLDFAYGDENGPVMITVRRTGGSTGAVSVAYETVDESATAGSDYTPKQGRLDWADGDAADKTITVELIDDADVESGEAERFGLQLSDPVGGAMLGLRSASVLIGDNDPATPPPPPPPPQPSPAGLGFALTNASVGEASGAVVLNVSRSGGASGAVSVGYATSSGSAIADSDFTSASGTLTWADGDTAVKTITVNMTNDSTDESDETLTVTLSNPSSGAALGSNFQATVTIVDDDSPAPPPPPPPSRGNSGGGALGLLSLLLLGVARFVRRPCHGVQRKSQGDHELEDQQMVNAQSHYTLAGSRPRVTGLVASALLLVIGAEYATAADGPGELLFFGAIMGSTISVTEKNGFVSTLVARAHGSTGEVSVDYTTIANGATAGADFAATSGTLTWADGDANAKRIRVEIFDDAEVEGDEGFYILMSNPTGGVTIRTRYEAVVIIDNDPSAPRLTLNKSIVPGCRSVIGKLQLPNPAPAGGRVVYISDTLASVTTPAKVTVPEGATTTTFSIKTTPVWALRSGTITADFGDTIQSRKLSVRPIGMLSVGLVPTTVTGTQRVAGTAKLECKAAPGPITVNLASSNAAVAHPVAASIVVPQGLQSVSFDVVTNKVWSTRTVAISGTANGIKKSKVLTVTP